MASLHQLEEANLIELLDRLFSGEEPPASVEVAAQRLARGMVETFRSDGKSELVLSRVFHSFEYQTLPGELQERAAQAVGKTPGEHDLFLSLLGTHGDEADWQTRSSSRGHQAIPITRETVKKIPMITRLFQQMGIDLGLLLGEGSPGINVSGIERSYGVFYVPDAAGSPYVPAQDFVEKSELPVAKSKVAT